MRRYLIALLILLASPALAYDVGQPNFPQILPAGTVLGRSAGSPGPTEAIPFSTFTSYLTGLPYTQLQLLGATSGTATLQATSVAGTPTLTFGTLSGTVVSSVTAPIAEDTTLGTISITGAAGQVLQGATPAFTATPTLGIAGTTKGTLALTGNTSGTVTITPQATAGTATFTLPNASGTAAVTASAPIVLSATTGNLTFTGSQVPGTTTNDNPTAGNIGEVLTAATAAASQTTATPRNGSSISLTAGDWLCSGYGSYVPAATTSVTRLAASLTTTTATLGTVGANTGSTAWIQAAAVPTVSNSTLPVGPIRFSLSATTTVFLVVDATFTVSTMTTGGVMNCWRIR